MVVDREFEGQVRLYQKLKPFLRLVQYRFDDEFGPVPESKYYSIVEDPDDDRYIAPPWAAEFFKDDCFESPRPLRSVPPYALILWLPNRKDLEPPSFEQFRQAYYGGLS